ncbi:MAG: hypothetical protein H6810_06565 [Phycisphaeraceae bacterium]|nr:MAG: hypothetical protein H6810_06565 [Phycisphaeraceae bacterium]
MGKPQPRLTIAIVLILIVVASGVVWWTFRSTYSTTMRNQYAPSPTDLVNANSVPPHLPEQLLDRDRESVVTDLTLKGFTEDPPSGPNAFIRRSTVPEAGYLIDELIELTVDEQTSLVIGVHYTRTTDAPIKYPYWETSAP